MEELLNKLIEKGWKPRGNQPEESLKKKLKVERYNRKPVAIVIKRPRRFIDEYYSFRELFSKESGLWQFVCENEMVKPVVDIISICSYSHFTDDHDDGGWDETFPEYRLIESSLKDESELESFILNNIQLGE